MAILLDVTPKKPQTFQQAESSRATISRRQALTDRQDLLGDQPDVGCKSCLGLDSENSSGDVNR